MRPDDVGLGGFDSHALPPRARRRAASRVLATLLAQLLSAVLAAVLAAPAADAQRDSIRPPISPTRAFILSAIAPGAAQSKLDRGTGALFVSVEAIALTMYSKSRHDLNVARAMSRDSTPLAYVISPSTGLPSHDPKTGELLVAEWSKSRYNADRVHARKTHVEDWMAMLIFNHLFAGIDAFVAAQLWELPAQVQMRAMPRGLTVQAAFRW